MVSVATNTRPLLSGTLRWTSGTLALSPQGVRNIRKRTRTAKIHADSLMFFISYPPFFATRIVFGARIVKLPALKGGACGALAGQKFLLISAHRIRANL